MNVNTNSYATQVYATQKTNASSAYSQNDKPVEVQTSKLEQMQEKYKDVYVPIPETYSKADEDLQTSKIYEAYPDYVSFQDYLEDVNRIYIEELGGKPIALGDVLTQDQIDKQALAYAKAAEPFGGEDSYIEMIKGAQKIEADYPVNKWGKDESIHNAKELARFSNAATYEGLEKGMSIEEAKISAHHLMSKFMDTSYSGRNFIDVLIKAGQTDGSSKVATPEERYPTIDYNSNMDLRQYGIEGYWEHHDVVENQKGMIQEIEKKIGQFQFMLNNESSMKNAYSKLEASAQDNAGNRGYQKLINEQFMPAMQEGLNIFNNYKIYDSIDTRA